MTKGDQVHPTKVSSEVNSRSVAYRFASVLLGLLAGLIVGEIGLRWFGIEIEKIQTKRILMSKSAPNVVYHCYPSNPHGEFSPVPKIDSRDWKLGTYTFDPTPIPLEKLSETPWCVRYDYSSKLIRDREYESSPPSGVTRLAIIGDSFVFGEGVPKDKSLPRQIEALVGENYQVMNGGVVGANTADEIHVLKKIAEEAQCRHAVFVFIPNDITLNRSLANRQKYINDLIVLRDSYFDEYESHRWYGQLRATQLIGSRLALRHIHQETIQWYLDSYDPELNQKNLNTLAENLKQLSEIPNCEVAFVIYPLLEGFEKGYPLKPIHERVIKLAQQAGLPTLDLAPTFAGHPTENLWVHPADRHPNGQAHAMAAKAIVEWLRSETTILSNEASES